MVDVVYVFVAAELCPESHSKDFDVVLEWEGDGAEFHLIFHSW